MPDAPAPESLPREIDLVREMVDRIPEPLRPILTQERPIDFRAVEPQDPFVGKKRDAQRMVWFRAVDTLPDAQVYHSALLAYASDYSLLPTALYPHGVPYRDPRLMMASIDHSVWLHRRFRADEWLLYVMDSPVAAGARGFTRGTIYSRDGQLVASVAQEGLMRIKGFDATSDERAGES